MQSNHARTSKSLKEVRHALGIRLSDNLESARLVVIVEGPSDELFWTRALKICSPLLGQHLSDGTLAFQHSGGAPNLSYEIQSLRRSACDGFVIFDGDSEGRSAVNKALQSDSLLDADYLLIAWSDQSEAEVEDLLEREWVSRVITQHFGVDVEVPLGDGKWGDRLRRYLTTLGKSNTKERINAAKDALWAEFAAVDECPLSAGGATILERVRVQLTERLGASD